MCQDTAIRYGDRQRLMAERLRKFVELQHGCRAKLLTKIAVKQQVAGKPISVEVYIFDLRGHAKSTRAYAWASSEGSELQTVLHVGHTQSPIDAVRSKLSAQRGAFQ